MNIVVCGGAGFIGSHLIEMHKALGDHVVVIAASLVMVDTVHPAAGQSTRSPDILHALVALLEGPGDGAQDDLPREEEGRDEDQPGPEGVSDPVYVQRVEAAFTWIQE